MDQIFLAKNVWVTKLDKIELIEYVAKVVKNDSKEIIGNHNLHSIYLYYQAQGMKEFYEKCRLIHIDSMVLIFILKIMRISISRQNRLTSLDWLDNFYEMANKLEYKIFIIGGEPGIFEKYKNFVLAKYPSLKIAGTHGYYNKEVDSAENKEVINMICEFSPNILFTGMGMPVQEKWISDNYEYLKFNCVFNLGAFMDYFIGKKVLPPRVFGRLGLEWLFRFITEPKRLFKRYFVEPFFILYYIFIGKD